MCTARADTFKCIKLRYALSLPQQYPQHNSPVVFQSTMAKAHIVLVHGAYHQPQHWNALVKVLNAAGHTTSTPRLPSVSHTPPTDVLNADVTAIREAVTKAVAEGASSVVPVFHSYAGIPGFEALATLTSAEKAKIPRVVCIAAFVIPKENSVVSVQEERSRTYVEIDVCRSPLFVFLSDLRY